MAKATSVYMHTLNGQPAMFDRGQVCFVRDGTELDAVLVNSLREIRRQQQDSIAFRRSQGWDVGGYGYVRFKV